MLIENKDDSVEVYFRERNSEMDEDVYQKVLKETEVLFTLAENYILSIFRKDNSLLEKGLDPLWVSVSKNHISKYSITIYFGAESDKNMHWVVKFFLNFKSSDTSNIQNSYFYPIEFRRAVG